MRPQVPDGLSVRYSHHRYLNPDGKTTNPKGGWTTAVLYDQPPAVVGNEQPVRVVATGVAYCHLNDNFNRKIGRDIALGRALKSFRRFYTRDQHGDLRRVTA